MTLGSTRGLDVPLKKENKVQVYMESSEFKLCIFLSYFSIPQVLKSKFVGEFTGGHGVGQILFVGEH